MMIMMIMFYQKTLHKQPSTRRPEIKDAFRTIREELRSFAQISH